MTKITRRQFFEDTLLATAAVATASIPQSLCAGEVRPVGPNNRIAVGLLGCGNRGKRLASEILQLPDCAITHVCDPDLQRAEELAAAIGGKTRRPRVMRDLRAVFDDRSVDAVVVATPNHWHALAAIWAMQAGKDVYVEKPVSHNVTEGRRMVQVARRHGRICQAGTQNRSSAGMSETIAYLHAGKLGAVKLARSIVYGNRMSIGGPGHYKITDNIDYNLFAAVSYTHLTLPTNREV